VRDPIEVAPGAPRLELEPERVGRDVLEVMGFVDHDVVRLG